MFWIIRFLWNKGRPSTPTLLWATTKPPAGQSSVAAFAGAATAFLVDGVLLALEFVLSLVVWMIALGILSMFFLYGLPFLGYCILVAVVLVLVVFVPLTLLKIDFNIPWTVFFTIVAALTVFLISLGKLPMPKPKSD